METVTAAMKPEAFRNIVYDYYHSHPRELPWRHTSDAYAITVSELMLQQTQAERVIPKYQDFLQRFPTVFALEAASISDVLSLWVGLGYNRRALHLHAIAKQVVGLYQGLFPRDREVLKKLPGIGEYTSGAILAFAYNEPVSLIETNIRRALIHHFFTEADAGIHDRQLYPILEKVLDSENPRIWYWALMDYGSHLGKTTVNANLRSKHYTKQSKFKGSRRQLRGAIISLLRDGEGVGVFELSERLERSPEEIQEVITELSREGFPVSGLLARLDT